jgi:polyketide cyclase/dehydrase/lipid transport protein
VKLQTRARVEIPLGVAQAFELAIDPATFARVLGPLGPIPGISRIEMVGGEALVPGARRNVFMTDGSVVPEEILDHTPPTRHRYRWLEPPKPPFSWLVRSGEGDWVFAPAGEATDLEWTYRFELTSALAAPLAAGVLLLFRRWMANGLERLRAEAAAVRG